MQAEGYRCLYEEARRQKPKSAMALCWCFNEPWPTAANNSLISWPHKPKPAYYAVAEACRRTLASAKIPKFSWDAGEVLQVDLWMLNDAPEAVSGGCVKVTVNIGGKRHHLLDWTYGELEAGRNKAGPTIRFVLPSHNERVFTLHLEVLDNPKLNTTYSLCYRPREKQKPIFVLPGGENNA